MPRPHDRRRFERFVALAGEGRVRLRRLDDDAYTVSGTLCDISEAGLRMHLDRPLDPGTAVAIEIELRWVEPAPDGRRHIYVFADVVWADDQERSGPVRTAAVFTAFCRAGDRGRLMRGLLAGPLRLAA